MSGAVKRYVMVPLLIFGLLLGCRKNTPDAEGYRVVSQNPEKGCVDHQPRELLELKLKCADMGRRFESDLERGLRAYGSVPLTSRFAYNAKLNTCIYRGGSLHKGISHHFIVDLATNEELAG